MIDDRFQPSDIVNAAALAAALGFLAFLIVLGLGIFRSAVGEISQGQPRIETTTTTVVAGESTTSIAIEPAKPAAEVVVRVANGANRSGLATSGTRLLSQNGYNMLQGRTKEGEKVDESTVYFGSGFLADAKLVADLLDIDEAQVFEMPEDPGVEIDNANVVVILGEDADF